MKTLQLGAVILAVAGLFCVNMAVANDSSMAADLKATIALQGKPCDEIASSKRTADSDYAVACKDGNRYHVYVNAQGRVIVDKQ
jgi:hypothetical protein